ncbi:MAG: hypothetical protein AAGF11_38290 [Myxococcota bacterium]
MPALVWGVVMMIGALGSLAPSPAQAAEPEPATEAAMPSSPPKPPAEDNADASSGTDPATPEVAPRRTLDERLNEKSTIIEHDAPVLRKTLRNKLVYRDPERRFVAKVHPDGRASFRDRYINFHNRRIAGLYDVILKAQGTELHQTAKRAFLRSTYADRLAMRVRWTVGNVWRAEHQLWGELRAIWEDETKTQAERERILRQRWAECDVDVELTAVGGEVSIVDRQRRKVARRARRTIEYFVHLYVDPQASFGEVTPAQDAAIALAPDLFADCDRDARMCITVGDLLVGRRANAFDAGRGAHYYARACDADDPWACYELAVLHYLGLGVKRDDARAAELHDVACKAGVAQGCAHLVHLHRKGLGVPRNYTEAARYGQLACDRGLEDHC